MTESQFARSVNGVTLVESRGSFLDAFGASPRRSTAQQSIRNPPHYLANPPTPPKPWVRDLSTRNLCPPLLLARRPCSLSPVVQQPWASARPWL
jgi:hypothetical protein